MAAYAALVSLMHIIDQIKHHPRPPISLDKKQVESLTDKIVFLQEFLEGYNSRVGYRSEADGLEMRIADAAYAAEDVIESHIVDGILAAGSTSRKKCSSVHVYLRHLPQVIKDMIYKIHGGSTSCDAEKISSVDLYQGLQRVMEDMDSLKKEVMEIEEKMVIQHQEVCRNTSNISGDSSLVSSSVAQNTAMVGFDDVLLEIMDDLTGDRNSLHIIPIVGMGGIGKTTLARNIYANPLIKQHFDICAWATFSQEYSTRIILKEVLSQDRSGESKSLSEITEKELGENIYKYLFGRRYLIVMDDMWSIEAWDKIKFFFPDCNNGSRIVVTTRLSNLAFQLTGSYGFQMNFLDENDSWELLCKTVFGEEGCPIELKEIGKRIVKLCKGLPLSIIVTGGLLAKSKHIQGYWEYVAENLNSVVSLEDNERCLKILHMSYNQLPVYLKPCFLYMGVFSEDRVIRVSKLIDLWVAEGFLKPVCGKSMEVVAEEYFKDLIDRNLILVHMLGSTGNIKFCKIHDLLRDFCLREVEKEKFLCVTRQHSHDILQGSRDEQPRRVAFHQSMSKDKVISALQSRSFARSLIYDTEGALLPFSFRLLRIFKAYDDDPVFCSDKFEFDQFFKLVNLRYIGIKVGLRSKFPSSVYLLWNLHTLIVDADLADVVAPSEIWKMTQLRHIKFSVLHLPDPPSGQVDGQGEFVLENLQTLSKVFDFKCSEEVVRIITNVKKLAVYYSELEGSSLYCLDYIGCLQKLESFSCFSFPRIRPSGTDFLEKLTFPLSLKKLSFKASHVHWEDVLVKIGSLPFLEKLKLMQGSFKWRKWETVEGQFCSLKFLLIEGCRYLNHWKTESTHFPRLEHLILRDLRELTEIPSDIGEILTLQTITMTWCSESSSISAQKILDEQEELHGEVSLQVRVDSYGNEAHRN